MERRRDPRLVRAERARLTPDENARRIEAHFGGFGRTAFAPPDGVEHVFLCFTNRSGSNYLADLLAATARINRAEEAFLWESVAHVEGVQPQGSFERYIGNIAAWNAVEGRFAVKAGPDQLALLGRIGWLDLVRRRARYLLIERTDRLGQAISFAIAARTGAWASWMQPQTPSSQLAYDRAAIDAAAGFIATGSAQLQDFFTANALNPLRVRYEALLADPQAELDRIGAWLGTGPLPYAPDRLRTRRQGGALNAAWRARYLAGD